MTTIQANLQAVRSRIEAAARKYGRNPGEIALLAVSKTWPASCLKEAIAAGQRAFGENYAQEGVEKVAELADDTRLEWHFIGPVQSNKSRRIAESFAWVHSVDRLKIAQRLSEQRSPDRPPLHVCLQVNIDGEAGKSGVYPEDASALACSIARLPHLVLRGLMSLPAPVADFEQQRAAFRRLHEIFVRLRQEGLALDTLSMGMSHDLEAAIAEGATLVRVGSAIFGERKKT